MSLFEIPVFIYSIAVVVCLLFNQNRNFWVTALILVLLGSLVSKQIQLIALVWIGLLAGALYWHTKNTRYSLVFLLISLVIGVLLGLHELPGFNNFQYLDEARLSKNSATFDIWFNYDKAFFGILVVGIVLHQDLNRTLSSWTIMLKQSWWIVLFGLPFIYSIGMVFAYSQIELNILTPGFHALFWPWVFKNLFFTVIAEEAMFRGLIQRQLSKHFAPSLAMLIAALLFGFAHVAGGWQYVLLSTLAGIVYGYAYLRTGRIEAAILAHLLLNVVHFLFFTYPYALSV